MDNLPLVSVPVVTYNSSKYVLETLESIKAQTYQNIELIVSDDCSTDNTVKICRKWIEENANRFVRTELITSPTNTGISANLNRAEAACRGEWVKPIAGDDLLLPECVESCINYVLNKNDVIFLFGRIMAFGAEKSRCESVEQHFDSSFFGMPIDQQLHHLIFTGNCIPASTAFYNRLKYASLGISNDERIPLMEDWAKWINVLRKGVRLYYIDLYLVKYRIGGISTGEYRSLTYYRSHRLMYFYYIYPELLKEDVDKAVSNVVNNECACYAENLELKRQLNRIRSSFVYKCYSISIYPIIRLLKSLRKKHTSLSA